MSLFRLLDLLDLLEMLEIEGDRRRYAAFSSVPPAPEALAEEDRGRYDNLSGQLVLIVDVHLDGLLWVCISQPQCHIVTYEERPPRPLEPGQKILHHFVALRFLANPLPN